MLPVVAASGSLGGGELRWWFRGQLFELLRSYCVEEDCGDALEDGVEIAHDKSVRKFTYEDETRPRH